MQLAIDIDHSDPGYVEERGSYPLLSHLRGSAPRVEHRRRVITRAHKRFDEAARAGLPEPELDGYALRVIQSVLFSLEDFGGLLYGLKGPNPWQRLRTTKIPHLDEAFAEAAARPEEVVTSVFRL